MSALDHRIFFRDLQYRRRAMARRAGGMVVAIALSSCIGAGVAYADDAVALTESQQQESSVVEMANETLGQYDDALLSDDAASDVPDQPIDTESADDEAALLSSGDSEELDQVHSAALDQDDQSASLASSADSTIQNAQEDPCSIVASASSVAQSASEQISDSNPYEAPATQEYSAFDLRHYGGTASYDSTLGRSVVTGGINYVTPVKSQNPFGSCWAFSSTAASETSLLSELDLADDGVMNGTVCYQVAATWLQLDLADNNALDGSIDYGAVPSRIALLAEYASDLSERHLAYFSFYDVASDSIYPDQASEGRYLSSGSTSGADILNVGGTPWLSMLEYSSGFGPVPEFVAPYLSDEGLYQCAMLQLTEDKSYLVFKDFSSYQDALDYYNKTWTAEAVQAFNDKNGLHLKASDWLPTKSPSGTWSVSDSKAFGVVAELTNSNVIDQDLSTAGLTSQEIDLMKSELLAGRAISIAFLADQSLPGQTLGGVTYLNTETWGQYTYDALGPNHAVTVVGYDDTYAASNFTHKVYMTDASGNVIYDSEGNPVVDEELTALTTPAGNGAWIVKNSWGYADAEDPTDQKNWGIDGSGYFYLSYYDKTISFMESYEYDVSDEALEHLSYVSYQHNLSNVPDYLTLKSSTTTKTCNVFDGPEQGEGSITIRDLGFLTAAAGDAVKLEVYVMDAADDVVKTIESSEPVTFVNNVFDCSGFHRIHLDSAIKVMPGQKFAIVQTTVQSDGAYEYVFLKDVNEEYAEALNKVVDPLGESSKVAIYAKAVVNKGESLFMSDGEWSDLLDVIAQYNAEQAEEEVAYVKTNLANLCLKLAEAAQKAGNTEMYEKYMQVVKNCESFNIKSVYAIDNFCIKAYADATGVDLSKALVSVVDDVYDGSSHRPRVTVTLGGIVLCEGLDYVLSGDILETQVGAYNIVISGINDFMGELTAVWNIVPAENPEPAPEPDDNVVPSKQAGYDSPAPESVFEAQSEASPKTGDDAGTATGFAAAIAALSSAVLLRLRRRRG